MVRPPRSFGLFMLLLVSGVILLGSGPGLTPAAAQQVAGVCGPPTVTVSATPRTAGVGQSVRFSFSAVAGGGCINPPLPSMLIGFGDGTSPLPLNGPSGTITHAYNGPGIFTVRVTATSAGLTGQATTTVTVTSPGQSIVTLAASPQSVVAGQQVDFTGQVIVANPGAITTGATIFFGDGQSTVPLTTGAGFIAQHSYANPGTYTATLSVNDSTGRTTQATTTITVSAAGGSVVTLSANPRIVPIGQQVEFTGQVISAPPGVVTTGVTISFGDGRSVTPQTTGAGFIAQHVYTRAGNYQATLTVTDSSGATTRATTTVIVSSRFISWP